MSATVHPIVPSFIALHGNRAEDLAQAVVWLMQSRPLAPLEDEVVLVQSNGMAEWFKMTLAQQLGVCAAARVELPGRFLWRTYRQVLGPQAVPPESALDKLPMTWRLLSLLPQWLTQDGFEPLQRYLQAEAQAGSSDAAAASTERQLQLAAQLADLFDQYQNHRPDWLDDWAGGRDTLARPQGAAQPVPDEQRWQALLWRAVLASLPDGQTHTTRPALHRQVLAQLHSGAAPVAALPRRVVVFGMSALPGSTLALLAALAHHTQVVLAVPNPCRFYWGDAIEGRELFAMAQRRHGHRGGVPLASVPLEAMHAHAHPLLAAWGRQSRDFIRQLDAFDDVQAARQAWPAERLDLFDETPAGPDTPLLQRIHMRIRDLVPLGDMPDDSPLPEGDVSVLFDVAHTAVRELEVLHDRLLNALQQPGLQPRDVVVMVPDVQALAPAIRAVFGRYPVQDARHIPFDIADLSAKASSPLVATVESLLKLHQGRLGLSELMAWLDVPAVARRLRLSSDQLPLLHRWMAGAGIRWGLNGEHRAELDLSACGEQNSAWQGLQRMLLGYACGSLPDDAPGWRGLQPYTEVGGLDAEAAGALALWLDTLTQWWQRTQGVQTPRQWVEHARWLLGAAFVATDDSDERALAALDDALMRWLRACELAGFDQSVDVVGLRHGWLDALQQPRLEQRFRAGGVTFCTLMPMRAIPFDVVCLLGMNEADYPRRNPRSDFDLMALPGQFRPGDRSRQHDDRQLMLEALLSARRQLIVSWTGRSVRDNSEQPPSVLVSQLRDYIAAVWGAGAVKDRTTEHPLQPFSRRYFSGEPGLFTHAREWRAAHRTAAADTAAPVLANAATGGAGEPASLDLDRLLRFLRNPVRAFFQDRLQVRFWTPEDTIPDTEAFDLDALQRHQRLDAFLRHWPAPGQAHTLEQQLQQQLDALQRAGDLPMRSLGQVQREALGQTLSAMAQAWGSLAQTWSQPHERLLLEHRLGDLQLRHWLDPLWTDAKGDMAWLQLDAGKLIDKQQARLHKMVGPWLISLLAAVAGHRLHIVLVGTDGWVHVSPGETASADEARDTLDALLTVWQQGQQQPLPLPLKTALAMAEPASDDKTSADSSKRLAEARRLYEGSDAPGQSDLAEVQDMSLARLFPDFDALCQAGDAHTCLATLAPEVYGPLHQWAASCVQVHAYEDPT